ncbi:MAG TPA: MarR family transcriptional regulator [Acidobacteriaceae bacterium]|jgi:DNA-binding MarR family transcriptional regulator|nr:MarR family transcriptional regulator [Acidobacteriaceae bacterium]
MDSLKSKKQSAAKPAADPVNRPILERISKMKAVLQGCRVVLDEELQPLGITTSQLRMLWSIAENPGISGAKMARLCSVTPQSGQATLAMMEAQGWVRRRPSEATHRVLVAELTSKGQRVLVKARELAKALDRRLWHGITERDLSGFDTALRSALEKVTRP